MKGKFKIDGIDMSIYGLYLLEGSYESLLSYPQLKEPDKNSWQEEDGEEIDLSNPTLDSKLVELNFVGIGKYNKVGKMIEMLSDGAYHNFAFDIGLEKTLRLIINSSYIGNILSMRLFSLSFSDDFPLTGFVYSEPENNSIDTGFSIDGKTLSEYGIITLQGTEESILKIQEVKENLLINLPHLNGVIYDAENVTFKSKDVVLKLFMKFNSFSEFYSSYNAFLFDLVRPGERTLTWNKINESYKFYYKSSKITKFYTGKFVWCEFDLNIVFTDFRITAEEYLLATENSNYLATQDNNKIYANERN